VPLNERDLNPDKVSTATRELLLALGVDLTDRNFKDTPARVARFMMELFRSKRSDMTAFTEEYDGMIILRGHEMWTLCPHHLLPVRMMVSIAYIPSQRVLGLSKLVRLVERFNTKPLMQEEMTHSIADWFADGEIEAAGSACYITGEHLCMRMRGVKTGADVVTAAFRGQLQKQNDLKKMFMDIVCGREGRKL